MKRIPFRHSEISPGRTPMYKQLGLRSSFAKSWWNSRHIFTQENYIRVFTSRAKAKCISNLYTFHGFQRSLVLVFSRSNFIEKLIAFLGVYISLAQPFSSLFRITLLPVSLVLCGGSGSMCSQRGCFMSQVHR